MIEAHGGECRGSRGGSSALRGGTTGDTTDSARPAGPAPRASAAPGRRWVPPSTLRSHAQPAPDVDAKHDVIFRKVRGILNKLTPEKFQKLSDDLLALELDSDKVLKGVILLIFEKALDEPKYSSMYAQLCKRLSEEAPDFEPRGSPCTFKLLLLNKCRAEFENRALAFQQYEERALLPDEREKRHLAKCKMLGNIKFIGELGKLEILAESILHRCIQNLLARRAAADHHEDLECLAQLVRTCGRVLDSERGRGLMDQYFARIEQLSRSRDLQPRIRFMLRDVVELRRGAWVPRAACAPEGPVPMHQLRDDRSPPPARRHAPAERDALFRGGRARPLDDVFAGLALQAPARHAPDKLFGNGFSGARDAYRQRSAPAYFPRAPPNNNHNHNHYSKQHPHPPANNKEGGARASKARLPPAGALQDVQMRPAANSLMFTANRISKPPVQAPPPAPASVLLKAPLLKEPAITIKPAPDKRDKPKKDKGPNKEEACRLALEAVASVALHYEPRAEPLADADADADMDADADADAERAPLADPLRRLLELQPPDKDADADADADAERAPLADPLRRLLELQPPDKVVRRCIACVLESALSEGEGGGGGAGAGADGRRRGRGVGGGARGALREARAAARGGAPAAGGARGLGARARAAGAPGAAAPAAAGGRGGVVRGGGRAAARAAAGRAGGRGGARRRARRRAPPRGRRQARAGRVPGRGRRRGGRGRGAGGAGGARAGRAGAAAARARGAGARAGVGAGAARAVPLDQGQRGGGRARLGRLRVGAGGAGGGAGGARGGRGAGARQGGAGAREGAAGGVRARADGPAGAAPRPAAGRRVRGAAARAPPRIPQGHAAALVHAPVQPGGMRGRSVPALARGRHGRISRKGRGALPGEHVADVAAAAGVGGGGGRGLAAPPLASPPPPTPHSPPDAGSRSRSARRTGRFYFALISL